ncbi:hypothetical protein HU200_041073 [Digitaria exilis]|uniref:Uncharacterized protein n=1 Tax=Digitaria exilis TaxID=1010633 RepID=A0A835BG60_9POAL|nr:hypothetical protein HU200_041073 [Digitaria exilis]
MLAAALVLVVVTHAGTISSLLFSFSPRSHAQSHRPAAAAEATASEIIWFGFQFAFPPLIFHLQLHRHLNPDPAALTNIISPFPPEFRAARKRSLAPGSSTQNLAAAQGRQLLEAESGGRRGPCPPPPDSEEVDEVGEGPDLISGLPDDLLSKIITPGSHYRPLWRAAPLNLKAAVEHRNQDEGMAAITGTLRAHGGPVRRVSLPWHGDCHHFPELDCVLIQSSPGLNNLQEFDLHYVPRIEYYSQLLPVPHSVASVLSFSIRSSSSKEKFLQFPMRSACTLSSHAPIEQLRLSHLSDP